MSAGAANDQDDFPEFAAASPAVALGPWIDSGRKPGYYVCRVDAMNQVIARMSPTLDTEADAEAFLEQMRQTYAPGHAEATIGCDLLTRRVRTRP